MTAQTGLAVSRDGSNNGTTPKGFRLAVGGMLAKGGASGLDVRKGILWDGAGSVVTGTASMTYSVRSCVAVVMPSSTQGPVLVANDAAVVVATGAAPGSNSRIDVIWVRQHLVVADGGADTDVIAEFGVTQGAVAASPVASAIPSGALEIARATVTAGTTATNTLTISQTHPWTVADGAPIPVRNDTERGALTPFSGMLVNHLGSKQLQRYDGSTWAVVGGEFVQSGVDIVDIVTVNVAVAKNILFPVPYPSGVVPEVIAKYGGGAPHQRFVGAYNESNTGFTVTAINTGGSADVSFTWIAVGPSA